MEGLFETHPDLDERDRAFINNLVQGVLRWRLRLDWIIGQFIDIPLRKLNNRILDILRLAVYQVFFLDRVPDSAAVNEAVTQAKADPRTRHFVSFVNGVLRNLCRNKDSVSLPERGGGISRYLSVHHSYPEWLVEKWVAELGVDSAERLLEAQNRISDLNIRTNTLKTDRDGLLTLLSDLGVNALPAAYAPDGVVLKGFSGRIDRLRPFRDGLFQVQDQAAQIVSCLLAPKPGDEVLDMCAGLGGKSTHLAELMKGKGRVIALDSDPRRLSGLGENSRRLGISCINPLLADASNSLSSLLKRRFRHILIDAPCSGLGVLSRHPDGKWRHTGADIARISALQKTILREAASVLESGGRMLYVTCSISREENEGVVDDLLQGHADISLIDLKKDAPDWCLDLIDHRGLLKTLPHVHQMDGFFAALLTRR